jgi:hypothetical protein
MLHLQFQFCLNLKTFLFTFSVPPVQLHQEGTISFWVEVHFHPLVGFNAKRSKDTQICQLGI